MLPGVALIGFALAVVPSTTWLQQAPPRAPVDPDSMRVELTGPRERIRVWAASEWTLRLENRSLDDGPPCAPLILEQSGWGGAFVCFGISKDGAEERPLTSRNFGRMSSNCGWPSPWEWMHPGASADLPVVLHGEMVTDLGAVGRDEKVVSRFVPAFETPGSYTVTPVLRFRGTTFRGNAVKVEVADAPPGSETALEELKKLVGDGLCIDVQGLDHNEPWSLLERFEDLVERQGHTLYGAQMRAGLAQAFLEISRAKTDGLQSLSADSVADLERSKRLLAIEPSSDVGLERMYRRLREELATLERAEVGPPRVNSRRGAYPARRLHRGPNRAAPASRGCPAHPGWSRRS